MRDYSRTIPLGPDVRLSLHPARARTASDCRGGHVEGLGVSRPERVPSGSEVRFFEVWVEVGPQGEVTDDMLACDWREATIPCVVDPSAASIG